MGSALATECQRRGFDYFISFFSFELFPVTYAVYSVKTCLTLISHFCALKKINTSPYNTLTFTVRLRVSNRVRVGVRVRFRVRDRVRVSV